MVADSLDFHRVDRDEAQSSPSSSRIDSGARYPVSLHRGDPSLSLPVVEQIAERILSLPLCAELFENELDRIIEEFLQVARP